MRRPVIMLLVAALLGLIAVGGTWVNYKKPWVMDDFRSGYLAASEGELVKQNSRGCALMMTEKYDVESPYVQYETPEGPSAFYLGCMRGLAPLPNDWWNASGYLNA